MNFINVILIIFIPALFVYGVTPIVSKLAFVIGATDKPNERKVHQKIMPRLGGLGIFGGFLLGIILFSKFIIPIPSFEVLVSDLYGYIDTAVKFKQLSAIVIASVIIVFVGCLDDIIDMRALYKLFGQIIAAMIIVLYGGIKLDSISAFGLTIDFTFFTTVISILWIVGITNAINLIDGLDGLAAGISSIYFVTIAIVAKFAQIYDPVIHEMVYINDTFSATIALIMFGSSLGFLYHNFHPAKIFMGDTGALFLGLIVSILPLMGFKNVTFLALFIPMLILAVPILDVIFAIFRRLIKGEKISVADKEHIHHQLINMKLGQRKTVLIIYAISILFSLVAILFSIVDRTLALYLFGFLSLIIVIFVETTSILSEDFKPIKFFINSIKSLGIPKKKKN